MKPRNKIKRWYYVNDKDAQSSYQYISEIGFDDSFTWLYFFAVFHIYYWTILLYTFCNFIVYLSQPLILSTKTRIMYSFRPKIIQIPLYHWVEFNNSVAKADGTFIHRLLRLGSTSLHLWRMFPLNFASWPLEIISCITLSRMKSLRLI